ncbi:MAG TPA: magnesium/cobalt transporter CorA [Blastocatellia bacterium]|nr:magnesium/cobalt transporter CorA [Blastocatellia bacterium]
MIQALVLNRQSRTFAEINNAAQISDLRADTANVLWVDVNEPTEADYHLLVEEFSFHQLAIDDCRNAHQRPKVDEYEGYYFIVLYEAELTKEGELYLREINLFLGKNYLVTVHSQPIQALARGARLWRGWTDLAERGSGLVAYLLIDAIVDDYLPLLDKLSDRMDDLEDQLFGEFQPGVIEEIFRIKKQLLYLRRAIAPLRDVFNTLLRREQPIFSRETLVYFQDVYDHLIRVADTIDTLRDLLGSTMDVYLSISGNRMNMIMKRLTSISTILMSVTLIASIYGMNFRVMPELQMRYGYVGALSAMLFVGVCIYFFFRWIKWL